MVTKAIQQKLSDSKSARWSALVIVSVTMMFGYFSPTSCHLSNHSSLLRKRMEDSASAGVATNMASSLEPMAISMYSCSSYFWVVSFSTNLVSDLRA